MKPDHNDLSPEEIVKRKVELAHQVFFLVVKQACEDLKKKLAEIGKELPSLR